MSQDGIREPSNPNVAAMIADMDQMEARQVTAHEWTVTSWRNGSATAHSVNIREISCTCEDMQYNRENNEVCDHILLANHYADRTMDVGEALAPDLHRLVRQLKESADTIERRAAGVAADAQASPAQPDTDSSQASADEWDGDPVEATKSLLRDAGWPVDQLDIWTHEDLGSVQIDNKINDDDEWSQFNDWAKDQEFLNYDRDEYINFIKPGQFPEVFA